MIVKCLKQFPFVSLSKCAKLKKYFINKKSLKNSQPYRHYWAIGETEPEPGNLYTAFQFLANGPNRLESICNLQALHA
jgi:hypothetical protein